MNSLCFLYTFLVISLTRYKNYIIWRILSSKFSNALPAFTCATAVGNPMNNVCLASDAIVELSSKNVVTLPLSL